MQQYQIDVDPNRLRLYNLPLSTVVDAVRRSNAAGRCSRPQLRRTPFGETVSCGWALSGFATSHWH